MNVPSVPVSPNAYAAGSLIATYVQVWGSYRPLSFELSDWLGTKRVQTDYQGGSPEACNSLPFGNGLNCTGNSDANDHHFTGKERDPETGEANGNDYFGARYYASSTGRFLSTDPKQMSMQRLIDPQQWNMYSYARNSPTIASDPDGREVKLLNEGALQRIQSTLPANVRSQVTVDKNGMLDSKSVAAIKSDDSNLKALQTLVASPKTVEFGTGKGAGGYDFMYQTEQAAKEQIRAAGADPSGQQGPNLYLGLTTAASQSPDGNTQVMVSDGKGDASTAPEDQLAITAAHELYVHALNDVEGKPYGHEIGKDGAYDPNGAVNKQTIQVEKHTRELQQTP